MTDEISLPARPLRHMPHKQPAARTKREEGAALVMALVVLLVLTITGTSGMRGALLDLNTSSVFADYDHAFQSAETGLRIAENIIEQAASADAASTALAAANISVIATDSGDYSSDSFWDGVSFYGSQNNIKIVAEHYRTVSDSLDLNNSQAGTYYYKITARGIDPYYEDYLSSNNESMDDATGVVILQSIYARRYAP